MISKTKSMNFRRKIVADLSHINKSLDYAVIRNYEFLFDKAKNVEHDIDLLTIKITSVQRRVIESRGYFLTNKSKYRATFAKFFPKQNHLFFLDFHIKNLTGNPISYNIEKGMIFTKRKLKGIPIPTTEYYLTALLLRETLAEGFKLKYQRKLSELLKKADKRKVVSLLSKNICKQEAVNLIQTLSRKDFLALGKYRKQILIKFILKNFFRYIHALFYVRNQKKKIIALIGIDGSGKSTIIKEAEKVLKQNDIEVSTLYMGRGGGNILPVQKPASFVKNRITNYPRLIKTAIYSASAIIYYLDFVVRYYKQFRFAKGVILTDRFCSDILLMPNVPKVIRKFLYIFSPKPDMYIYIYNTTTILKKRRPEHDYKDLIRQEKEFRWINKLLKSEKVKNRDIIETLTEVVKLILSAK